MAKGSGSAGRTGRTRPEDGPIIIDLPPGKTKRPRTPGSGGTTGGTITGIPEEYEPRPDLKWYQNDKRPVKASERIYTPQQGENVETYNKAKENIDKVHAVRAEQAPMQWRARSRPGDGTLGQHVGLNFVDTDPESPTKGQVLPYSDIVLNTGYNAGNEPAKRGTLYHETGHGHDFGQNYEEKVIPNSLANDQYHKRKYDSENAFEKVRRAGTLEPNPKDTPTVQWAKSVQRSTSYKNLVEKREKAKKERNSDAVKYLNYLTDPKELYARSYTQYISKHADPEVMKESRRKYKERDSAFKQTVGYDQWRGKDFDTIDQSFDRIFGSRGLDTKNQEQPIIVPITS